MPAWIHDRAERLKPDLQKQYGKEKGEQVAFALATQQAHRLGKSPKTFKSKVTGKKEPFGTPGARRAAKLKYDQPRSEYRKTAQEALMVPPIVRDLALDILEKEAKLNFSAIGKGLKKARKKVVGTAPGEVDRLHPGSGLKKLHDRYKDFALGWS